MIIRNVELETVCGITSKLPENDFPEIAFAGKSNVGKSSLINGLLNRKALARTSATPGKTQTINFYHVNKGLVAKAEKTGDEGINKNDELFLVDLPGYGYAKVSEAEKVKWGKLIERYLHESSKLKVVFLLIDIRHKPSENDCMMYDWIVNQGYAPVIIATKLDKIKRSQKDKQLKIIRQSMNLVPGTTIIPFSAETKQGRDEIWNYVDEELKGN